MKSYSYYIKRICTRLHKLKMLDTIPTDEEIKVISKNLKVINDILPQLYELEANHSELSQKQKIKKMLAMKDNQGRQCFQKEQCKGILKQLPRLINYYHHLCDLHQNQDKYKEHNDKVQQEVELLKKNYVKIQQQLQDLLLSKRKILAKFEQQSDIPQQVRDMFVQMGGQNNIDLSHVGIFDVLTKPLWVLEEVFPPSSKWLDTINSLLQMSDVFVEKLEPIVEFIVPTLEIIGEKLITILFDILQAIPFAGTTISAISVVLNTLQPVLEIGENLLSNLPIIGDNYDSRAEKITQKMGNFFTRINMWFNFSRGNHGAAIEELFEMMPDGDEISDISVLILNSLNTFLNTNFHLIVNTINYFIDRITGI